MTHPKPFHRLLLTGAAGEYGQYTTAAQMDERASGFRSRRLRASGRGGGDARRSCRQEAVNALVAGVDGPALRRNFSGITIRADRQGNIVGLHNVYGAVHKHNVRRVVYASSSHVVGFYPSRRTSTLIRCDPIAYAVSKCFGEALTRYYFDRFGIEAVCLRIGSSFAEPKNPRMLVSYLSYDDLVELVPRALFTARGEHSLIFGVSDNPVKWWDNTKAAHLGFLPRDSSRQFAHLFPPAGPAADDSPAHRFPGCPWVCRTHRGQNLLQNRLHGPMPFVIPHRPSLYV
jgi:uronate dehydrogenase